jgi:hypothetical protein
MKVTVVVVAALLLMVPAGCADVRWVRISDASAASTSATAITVGLDYCIVEPNPPTPTVVESRDEIRVRINLRHHGVDEATCKSSVVIDLAAPIGRRVLIDDRHHQQVPVAFGA